MNMMNRAVKAREMQIARELSHAKKGILWGVQSGVGYGLTGVIAGLAVAMAPFTGGASIYAGALAGAALHEGFAGLLLFLYNLFNGKWREYGRTLVTKPGMLICLAGMLGGPFGIGFCLVGIHLAGASYAIPISAIYPVIGAILAVFILKERTNVRTWVGLFLCIFGAIIIGYTPPEGSSPYFHYGILFAVLAALSWGIEGVLAAFGMDMVDTDIAIGLRLIVSLVTYLIVVLPLVGGLTILWKAFSAPVPLGYLALAGFLEGLSLLSWYKALNMTGVGRANALYITYALWGVVFGWLISHIPITPQLITGAILIISGTILTAGNTKELLNLRKT